MSHADRFSPIDRLAHYRPQPSTIASDMAQVTKPAYMLSDDAEVYKDIALRALRWAAAVTGEILTMRHERGFRDTHTMNMQELDGELYRAATGDNWLPRAREAGL